MADVGLGDAFGGIDLGGSIGTIGTILLVCTIGFIIIALIGAWVFSRMQKKQYWVKIHLFRLIGNVPTRVAVYCAREVRFGMAGDMLWKVAPAGLFKFKAIKWIPVGKIQTSASEFWYYIREDGEWINFKIEDLNEKSKVMGVKFVQEDMRLQRLATERLLEQRLMSKNFWEKWGTVVMTTIVFVVVAVCMVIIFYQFGKLLDKMSSIVATQDATTKFIVRHFGNQIFNANATGGSLVPT